MKPRDLLRVRGAFWEVQEICLGAQGQESVIICKRLDADPSEEGDGLLYIPELMLREAITFAAVDHYTPAPDLVRE